MLRLLLIFPMISVPLCVHLLFADLAVSAEKSEVQIRKQPEIRQIRPQKPVRIKLHRTAKGEYTWDLTGDNVDEIVKTDRRLRKLLNIDPERQERNQP